MSQPLLATKRITYPYTVAGRLHKIRCYVKKDPSVLTPPWFIVDRNGATFLWTLAAEQLAFAMGFVVQQTVGAAIFEELVGTIWNPTDVFQPTGQSAGGTPQPATEWVTVLRDTSFFKLHLDFQEGVTAAPVHVVAYTAITPSATNCLRNWTPDHSGANDPYMWQVSRGNRYLAGSPFVSTTISLNRKTRRARGLG